MKGGGLKLALGTVLLVVAAVFGRNPHPHMWWEAVPAYGALFGYGGAWLLIWVAKAVLAPRLRSGGSEDSA